MPSHQHLKGRRVLTVFKRACADAGEPGFKVHSLRHFAATTMLTNGVTPHLVALVLGHSSPSITLNYYAQALICLERIEKLANACVPTILAVVLVYHIIKFIKSQAK